MANGLVSVRAVRSSSIETPRLRYRGYAGIMPRRSSGPDACHFGSIGAFAYVVLIFATPFLMRAAAVFALHANRPALRRSIRRIVLEAVARHVPRAAGGLSAMLP